MPRYSVAIIGGWVVDGSGAPPTRADLAIDADRIAAVGRIHEDDAATVIDATDRYVLPGFIDAHAHIDALANRPDIAAANLHQGVTTLIAGQDGLSFAPAHQPAVRAVERYFAAVNGPCPAPLADGGTVADLLDFYDRSAAVNVAYAAPAGTIRADVMGYRAGAADDEQRRAMRNAVAQAIDHGAIGLSTGLEYVPGRHTGTDEIVDLLAPVSEAGGVYVSHLRGYEADAWRGLTEAFEIGRRANVAVHVSHLHGPSHMILELVDQARASGVDLTFDTYPYLRGSTIVAMVALPADLQADGPEATLRRLSDTDVRTELRTNWFPTIADVLPRITLSYLDAPRWRYAEGMTIPELAADAGMDPGDLICEIVVDTELGAGCVFSQPPTFTEADMRRLLRHEAHMGGSDAIYLGSKPHPRGWGTFARFLGRHTREAGDWTWGAAAAHLAWHPARRFGLGDRGQLRAGSVADVVVLDPSAVADRASYAHPTELAVGVDHVLISGEFALRDGVVVNTRLGRGLRSRSGRLD